jgi:hypothetical protein
MPFFFIARLQQAAGSVFTKTRPVKPCMWVEGGRALLDAAGGAVRLTSTSSCSKMDLAATFRVHHHACHRSVGCMWKEHFVAWMGVESTGA